MKRFLLPALAAAVTAAFTIAPALASEDEGATRAWRVTVENLTPELAGTPGSQPLSPPLFVVHSKSTSVWSVGEIANHGVAAIAEDADNSVLESALDGFPGVERIFTGAGGPIPSGQARSYVVETSGRFNRLTLVTMLVNTNDAFTGLDSLHVRGAGARLETAAYDAGSEKNNESSGFIPGPCCDEHFVRDPEGAVIRPHSGIAGIGDLDPGRYGWSGPAARITVEPL